MTWARIEITSGIISGPTRWHRGDVVTLDFSEIGERHFFIDAVEVDGGRIGLHDCLRYEEAITVAYEVAVQEGLPVVDLV
jgi:hypothetical protein